MKRYYFVVLFLLGIIFVSSCAKSNIQNSSSLSGNAVLEQPTVGLQKDNLPPDFTIKTIDDKEYRLRQFREENKPILLYFWATWCPFCRRDFSIVRNVYPKYTDKVTFLAIDLDTSETAEYIQQYKDAMGLDGIDFAIGNGRILSDYQITHTTTKYAIGRNGLILYKGSGVFNEQQWEILLNGLAES